MSGWSLLAAGRVTTPQKKTRGARQTTEMDSDFSKGALFTFLSSPSVVARAGAARCAVAESSVHFGQYNKTARDIATGCGSKEGSWARIGETHTDTHNSPHHEEPRVTDIRKRRRPPAENTVPRTVRTKTVSLTKICFVRAQACDMTVLFCAFSSIFHLVRSRAYFCRLFSLDVRPFLLFCCTASSTFCSAARTHALFPDTASRAPNVFRRFFRRR